MPITTLIFDIDDTLYDVGTGFTAHRNGEAIGQFMVSKLNFANLSEAMQLRDEYFTKYHATAKALTVAESEGRLPPSAVFRTSDLAEWWATQLDFSMLSPDQALVDALSTCPLKLVAFTNAPRLYAIRVLEALNLRSLFPDDRLFAVDDVLPHCKPEKEAFEKVLQALGDTPAEECVMIEDSMKNIRAAKALGMLTVLVSGLTGGTTTEAAAASEATKPGDAPRTNDPAVDVSIALCGDIKNALPGLWQTPSTFS
jgi:putative hydrolase of the HAD superfamily